MPVSKTTFMKKCFYACMVTVFCFCSGSLLAQHTLVLNNNETDIAISPYAYIYRGQANGNDIDQLLPFDSTQFSRNTNPQEVNYGVDQTSGWFVFFVRNESDQEEW